uniref:G_PROTEIN_RECEP_F1_2 domain-containing protein n=1 Tax=Macrostomum lignano TaxID=282301 RepID=A0A1I8JHK7_9PLAT
MACMPKEPPLSPQPLLNRSLSLWSANATADAESLSVYEIVLYAILAAAASAVTGFGNLLVLVSFRIDPQLRSVSNYFLMSLAVADLLIGFVSMPTYTVYLLVNYWPFGVVACNLYLCFDYTMCNASVASLLIISIDRYRSVTSPLVYRAHRTPRRALIMIACAWAVSIVLWSPLIVLSSVTKTDRLATVCQVEFINDNPYLTFFTSIMAFFLPVTVMTVLYVRIFQETKRRQRELKNLQAGGSSRSGAGSIESPGSSVRRGRRRGRHRRRDLHSCLGRIVDKDDENGDQPSYIVWIRLPDASGRGRVQLRSKRFSDAAAEPQFLKQPAQSQLHQPAAAASAGRFDSAKSNATADSGIDSIGEGSSLRRAGQQQPNRSNQRRVSEVQKHSKKESKNEQKAAKTLSAILLVFIITWIPYSVFTLIRAVYRAHCPDELYRPLIPHTLYNFGYWLCYLNSTMNPVCYALCNVNFRRTFWKILTCRFRRRRTLRQLGHGAADAGECPSEYCTAWRHYKCV